MSQITAFFNKFGMLAMFLCILLEYGCFPVSSEIVLPLSGAIASFKSIPLCVIIPLSVLAGLIGTTFCYLVGRLGGVKILERISRRFPKTKKPLEASFASFQKHGALAVGVGRVIPICRTYIAFVAGASNLSYKSFLFSSAIGIFIWNTLLISLGYILRGNFHILSSYYNDYKQVILLVLIFLLSISLIRSLVTNKNQSS